MKPERMKQIISRSNNPGQMVAIKGKNNIVNCYQKDTEDLIIYIRQLESKLNIKSTKLF